MALPPKYKIHPAIGIARLGDSPADNFFIGPETPDRPPEGDPPTGTAVPDFKDSGGRIKPQAARFRIWEYGDNGKGKYEPKREISADTKGVQWIEWTVYLANKKAAFFTFNGLLGDPVYGPTGVPPKRRNAGVMDRKKLWLDPGFRTIKGTNVKGVEFRKGTALKGATEHWPIPAPTPAIEYLGQIRTDDKGRLLVIGGVGQSSALSGAAGIGDYANNDGWFDDVSDGPVTARIKFDGVALPVTTVGAWVICAPPDFAPYAQNIVTLYDVLFDLAAKEMPLPTNDAQYDGVLKPLKEINQELKVAGKNSLSKYKPSFDEEIWPILKRALSVVYLFEPAQHQHPNLGASGNLQTMWPYLADPTKDPSARQTIFRRLHPPGVPGDGLATAPNVPNTDMPRLLGDDPYAILGPSRGGWYKYDRMRLTLTRTQYALLEQWAKGNFVKGSAAPPPSPPKGSITPHGLDRAALENCVGGAFFPGIEVGWQIRHPGLYQEPFRIKHGAPSKFISDNEVVGPGHFSRQMAVPWQADFLQCRQEMDEPPKPPVAWGWWPAQRPDFVYANTADATTQKPMVSWVRSTTSGAPVNWATGFNGDKSMPSFQEMLKNWRSFAFIHEGGGGVEFEDERPKDVP